MKVVKVGCCGFPVSMKKYYNEFKVVEIQSTFYKLPRESTVEKWRKEAPKDFEFTLKAFQGITHDINSPTWRKSGIKDYKDLAGKVGYLRPTKEVYDFWEKMKEIAKILRSSVIILQLPRSFRDTEENIKNTDEFFSSIERGDIRIGIELRGWSEENIKRLCENYGLIDVVDTMVRLPLSESEVLYFRLHGKYEGTKIVYSHKYTEDEIKKITLVIQTIDVKEYYVMFNNKYMYEDAKKLMSRLKQITL